MPILPLTILAWFAVGAAAAAVIARRSYAEAGDRDDARFLFGLAAIMGPLSLAAAAIWAISAAAAPRNRDRCTCG